MSAIKPIGEIVSRAIHTKEKWDRSDYIGASEITKCPLDLYWSKSEDDGFRGNGKTERGHAIEVALIRLLKKGGLDVRYHAGHVDRQKELDLDGYPIRSHPDGVIYEAFERPHKKKPGVMVKDHRPAAALEIKSVGSEAFRLLKEPKHSWVVQARLNAYLLGVPDTVLVAVNASDLEDVKEWRFEALSDEEARALGEKARKIMSAIELGLEPLAEPSEDNCRYCQWQSRCTNAWIPDAEQKEAEAEAPEIIEAAEAMAKAKTLKEEAKALESYARPLIMQAAKTHEAGKLRAGRWLAVVEPRKGSVRLDTKRLKAEHPEIDYTKYEKRSADTVALKIKEIES